MLELHLLQREIARESGEGIRHLRAVLNGEKEDMAKANEFLQKFDDLIERRDYVLGLDGGDDYSGAMLDDWEIQRKITSMSDQGIRHLRAVLNGEKEADLVASAFLGYFDSLVERRESLRWSGQGSGAAGENQKYLVSHETEKDGVPVRTYEFSSKRPSMQVSFSSGSADGSITRGEGRNISRGVRKALESFDQVFQPVNAGREPFFASNGQGLGFLASGDGYNIVDEYCSSWNEYHPKFELES